MDQDEANLQDSMLLLGLLALKKASTKCGWLFLPLKGWLLESDRWKD
jgi:hypothetical protein